MWSLPSSLSSCLSSLELMVSSLFKFLFPWCACGETEGKKGEGWVKKGRGGTWRRNKCKRV